MINEFTFPIIVNVGGHILSQGHFLSYQSKSRAVFCSSPGIALSTFEHGNIFVFVCIFYIILKYFIRWFLNDPYSHKFILLQLIVIITFVLFVKFIQIILQKFWYMKNKTKSFNIDHVNKNFFSVDKIFSNQFEILFYF